MNPKAVFIDRRKGDDRRMDDDPCKDIPLDLYHRKRRKSTDRRDTNRSLSDDYYAYIEKGLNTSSDGETSSDTL